MGGAIIGGLLKSGFRKKDDIFLYEINQAAKEELVKKYGINTSSTANALVENTDTIILAVKPFVMADVVSGIKSSLKENKLLISIAAGISTESLESFACKKIPVVRVMPNTPALLNEGMTAVCKGKYAKEDDIEFTKAIFSSVGRCMEVKESLMDAVTGISGSGPAFMYLIIEALADGGVKMGLPKDIAIELAAQTALGAAKMVLQTGKHPSVLKDEVTTPGGTTIAGLAVMEKENVRSALINTVVKTAKRSSELSK